MTKMIVALAVIAMTSVASAASFVWATDSGNMVNAPNTTVLYLYATTSQAYGNGDFNYSTHQLGGLTALGTYAQALGDNSNGVFDGYGYFVYDNGGGMIAAGTQYAVVGWDAGTSTKYGVGYVTIGTSIGDSDPQAAINATGFDITGYNAVPEPSSMALLAIGAVAMRLRRKFIKKA